jgi:hypothetical protein
MFTYAPQNIDQVGVRIDAMQSAGNDQALDDADVLVERRGIAPTPIEADLSRSSSPSVVHRRRDP